MNKRKLNNYAPRARREFIQAVIDRAAYYGLTPQKTEPIEPAGDFVTIGGRAFPKHVKTQREALEERIAASGFDFVMEEIAYTWFNRFVAIRYMELHGYLSHGYRVLSHPEPDNPLPEILDKAQYLDLAGLNKERVVELKMDGTKDEELYRMLLIAQCNELNKAMPFLFESIRDCTELLLPDNLLHSDSLIRKMVDEIEQADWQEVEIIGWMYQFYISEKKNEVIGKVVKSEDIPAATQLFTPNWIVKYLVQNSLGAQWMRTYPASPLKEKMDYYIVPAQQTPEVQQQLKDITPGSLNPEELTILDPACGSGHILVEAYDLLKDIYLERGYRKRDIPELILKKNLFGLEIDDRAAQLAGFAVMMKARADDRGFFDKDKKIQPHIVSIQESHGLDVEDIVRAVNAPLTEKEVAQSPASLEELQIAIEAPLFSQHSAVAAKQLSDEEKLTVDDLKALLGLFEHGKTFGSLIRIPEQLALKLPAIAGRVQKAYTSGQPFAQAQAEKVMPFIRQTVMMASQYDAVVANPPYMGGKGMNAQIKSYAGKEYPDTKPDLFAMFIERGFEMAKIDVGFIAMITQQAWMFLSSFESLRNRVIDESTIMTMAHNGFGAFGADFGTTSFTVLNQKIRKYKGTFISLREEKNIDYKRLLFLSGNNRFIISDDDFKKIPGSPIAYWVSVRLFQVFSYDSIFKYSISDGQNKTSNNDKYVRMHWEIVAKTIGKNEKWLLYAKGGDFRRWYGNVLHVVDWSDEARQHYHKDSSCRIIPQYLWYKKGITWTLLTSSKQSFRLLPDSSTFDMTGSSIFLKDEHDIYYLIGLLNSYPADFILKTLNPTLALQIKDVRNVPVIVFNNRNTIETNSSNLIYISQKDWDSFETSWDFSKLPVISSQLSLLEKAYFAYRENCRQMTARMKELEEENNRLFIDAYGLQDELTPEVPEEQITLFANPKYRYGANLSDEELEKRFKADTIEELISYSVGCMMGRYSLDVPGLVYAHSGNEGFDSSKYKTFPADEDGIVPITDMAWFDDDAAERFFKFVEIVWGKETLEENLAFAAQAIGQKTSESSREAIRRYFGDNFFKDHLKRYKKRPIYWLFSSGKHKAFQCLVYLHRYNESTLARMRTEYVIPLQGMLRQQREHLKEDENHAGSASSRTKIKKMLSVLDKQAEELRLFDEQLRHYADLKIKLDLDDGVKVNYGKFGNLLAEVKAIAGSTEDE